MSESIEFVRQASFMLCLAFGLIGLLGCVAIALLWLIEKVTYLLRIGGLLFDWVQEHKGRLRETRWWARADQRRRK